MSPLVILCLIAIIGYSEANRGNEVEWSAYKQKFGKSYTPKEDKVRFRIYLKSDAKIKQHNARYNKGEVKFFLRHNRFSDWTDQEIKKNLAASSELDKGSLSDYDEHSGFDEPKPSTPSGSAKNKRSRRSVPHGYPQSFDWRQRGVIGPVGDQGICDSCYAFAVTEAAQAALAIKHGKLRQLSVQNLLDCSYKFDKVLNRNLGCDGGRASVSMTFIRQKGLTKASLYPYTSGETGRHGPCKPTTSIHGKKLKIGLIAGGHEDLILKKLVKRGPVVVNIFVSGMISYGGGILDVDGCDDGTEHAVAIIGYGSENGVDFWIGKNSWGRFWGEDGYFRIRRGVYMCGFGLSESRYMYARTKKPSTKPE